MPRFIIYSLWVQCYAVDTGSGMTLLTPRPVAVRMSISGLFASHLAIRLTMTAFVHFMQAITDNAYY